jgi:hypothetical protein
MEFHQQHCAESMRDKIINVLLENSVFKEDLSFDHIKNMIPWDTINTDEIDSDSSDDEPEVKEEVIDKPFSDSISDDIESVPDITEEPVTETTTKKSKKKKEKKEKKKKEVSSDTDDKPKRAPSNFIYFKSHPESQDAINEASQQLQGEDDKKPGAPVGKVKGAGIVWKSLSDEEKEVWKQRVNEEFNIDQ